VLFVARRATVKKTCATGRSSSAAEYITTSADLKKELADKELARLKKLFRPLPENERTFIQPLLENAAFMRVTLDELQIKIRLEGATDEYQNGANQSGVKISAAIQAYNQLMKTYHTLMDKLMAKLPAEKDPADELDEFRL
jgi:acyl-CoA reductase-like NAD-dependent aldehyde dehydrogenase